MPNSIGDCQGQRGHDEAEVTGYVLPYNPMISHVIPWYANDGNVCHVKGSSQYKSIQIDLPGGQSTATISAPLESDRIAGSPGMKGR